MDEKRCEPASNDRTIRGPKFTEMGETRAPEVSRDFGYALNKLWDGHKVFRQRWNGKGMYLNLQIPDPLSKMSRPYIFIRTADNHLVPWVPSQTDLLSNDWEVFK